MTIRQVDNALRFFEYFAAGKSPATITQLAEALGLPLSSTSNLITTLRERGYLFELRRRGGFYPTRRIFDIGTAILEGDPILGLVREHMAELRDKTGETILLAARDGDDVIYLDVLESSKGVRYSACAGERRPIYAVSSGKAILSTMEDYALAQHLLKINYADAANTSITDPDTLLTHIIEGRRRGWFLNATEFTPEVTGVGVLLNLGGRVLGLSVAGPNYRMNGRHEELAEALFDTLAAMRHQTAGGAE
jgi:DNA-binding IclR family transcriptional regulator